MASILSNEAAQSRRSIGKAATFARTADLFERYSTAVAAGLLMAAVAAPIAVSLPISGIAQHLLRWTLVAALVVTPAAFGLAIASLGPRQIVFRARSAGGAAEYAVLRVFAAAAMLAYAFGLRAWSGPLGASGECVPVAAIGLVCGWALLLWAVLSQTSPPLRSFVGLIFDAALISAFLSFGGGATAGWYPIYIVLIFYAGLRLGLAALWTAAVACVVGFAAVVLLTAFWREEPALAAGSLLALVVLPVMFDRTLRAGGITRSAPADPNQAGATVPIESFDLRALVKQTLTPLQAKAADRGIVLRWRVDPRLPYRLRGSGDAMASVVAGFARYGMATEDASNIGVSLEMAAGDTKQTMLELRITGLNDAPAEGASSGLQTLARLVESADGSFRTERTSERRTQIVANVPLAAMPDQADPLLDLDRRPVLIAADDDELAGWLAEPLAAWNAEPRWLGGVDQTMAELVNAGRARRPIVIVDGRAHPLTALGVVRQAAGCGTAAPFVLLIANPDQLAGLAALDEGEIDGFIPAPLTEALLAKALYALPLPWGRRKPAATQRGDTPLDARAIDMLRALDGGAAFLGELIEAFRGDARHFMQRIEQGIGEGDSAQFAQGLTALRRAAAHLGGAGLCDLTTSLQRLDADDLRVQGPIQTRKLEAEVDRLCAALGAIAASDEPPRH